MSLKSLLIFVVIGRSRMACRNIMKVVVSVSSQYHRRIIGLYRGFMFKGLG